MKNAAALVLLGLALVAFGVGRGPSGWHVQPGTAQLPAGDDGGGGTFVEYDGGRWSVLDPTDGGEFLAGAGVALLLVGSAAAIRSRRA